MLAEWLPSDDIALATRHGGLTWSELLAAISVQAEKLERFRGKRVGVLLAPSPQMIAVLLACEHAGVHAFLIASDVSAEQVVAWSHRFGLSAIADGSSLTTTAPPEANPAKPNQPHANEETSTDAVTILTSGTTGEPKAVEHTWESLTRPVRQAGGEGPTWLLTFRPHLYAGLQVMMQCLLNQGTLVIPQSGDTADDVAKLAAQFAVDFASATPSYWRWLVTFANDEVLQQMTLKQITLGGEAVDQATLNVLRAKFPETRVVHIYATTELGRCFSVTDGLSGFPFKFLGAVSADGVEMKVDDGELVVRSANAMKGYDQVQGESPQESWFRTGDLVHIEGDRVHFVGRKTDMINVGGNKVYPLEVETVVRTVDGVADARVYGQESSMLGQLVKCDVVLADGFDKATVEAQIRKQCLADLTSYQLPRFIDFVEDIPKTAAGKTDRS